MFGLSCSLAVIYCITLIHSVENQSCSCRGDKADKCQSNEPPCKSEEAAQMVESTPPAMAEVADGDGKVKTVSPTAIIPDSAK